MKDKSDNKTMELNFEEPRAEKTTTQKAILDLKDMRYLANYPRTSVIFSENHRMFSEWCWITLRSKPTGR